MPNIFSDGRSNRNDITLEKCYELGLYVFAGQHKLAALVELKKEYDNVQLYESYTLGYICLMETKNENIYHHIKVVGNLANDVQEVHQLRGFQRSLIHVRARFERDDFVLSDMAKVFHPY